MCDSKYLAKYLAMRNSAIKNGSKSNFLVLALDKCSYEILRLESHTSQVVIDLKEILYSYPDLEIAQKNRARKEFIFSLTPHLISYGLDHLDPEICCYLDSDTYLLANPDFFPSDKTASIGIVPHNFPPHLKNLVIYGQYNVGYMYFRNCKDSKKVVKWWKMQCINSTSTDISTGVFGDQKYLDHFQEIGPKIEVIKDQTIGRAPWNSNDISIRNTKMFHFSGLQILSHFYMTGHHTYKWRSTRLMRKELYIPYIRLLIEIRRNLFNDPIRDELDLNLDSIKPIVKYRDFHLL